MIPQLNRRTVLAGTGLLAAGAWMGPGLAHAATAGSAGSALDLSQWSYVPALSDDFTDPARTSQLWHKGLWYPVSGRGEFKAENVVVDDGLLRLVATPQPGQQYQFGYGAVESHFDIPGVSSYVEVRAKALTSKARVLSAIWLQSSNRDGVDVLLDGANPNPEIDVLETFDYSQMNSATHIWPDNRGDLHIAYGGQNHDTGLADVSEDFHTYGMERRDGKLRAYFDGQLAWEIEAPHPSLALMSRHQVLSLEGHLGQPNLQFLPASFDIDYVKTWYFTGTRRAESGTYRLVNGATGRALMPTGDGLFNTIPLNNNTRTRWNVTVTDDFTYTIASAKYGTHLALEEGMGQEGVPVVLDHGPTDIFSAGSTRRWHVLPAAGDVFTIQSKFSGLALGLTPGGRLEQQLPDGSAGQQWRLVH